ncbi:predicted protein [Nematostella vectensis]|uniref:Uncharacterized protein n=1 Tax=Nematostella vectensis TaxID=45351 RepID=A7T4K2_NEMVE|nr:predicted protein [Nematostella vectensis]|eukprot:XP_001621212.1 hypothetical protein NEMVEDRAFT_v1g222246 [Nematostella vectensis]
MAVQATFQAMGLRSEKAVAAHLLLENAHESNLVSDISQVDYLAGNQGRTHLRPLEGLPTFVDDVYVFGYLRREDCVVQGGRLSCTTWEGGAAKNAVRRVSIAVHESIWRTPDGTRRGGHAHTSLVHTVATRERTEGSTIRETIARIEFDTGKKALAKWRELYPETEPAGLFVAKVDVSEVPMAELQAALPAFERQLLRKGYGLYTISGVLDRKTLVEHLCASEGFREQGDLAAAMRVAERDVPTVLANTDSVGKHVCTWVRTSAAGHTVQTKLYNKVVSNFEAGEVRESVGGHLADYVDCRTSTCGRPSYTRTCRPEGAPGSRGCEARLLEIQDAAFAEEWKRHAWAKLAEERRRYVAELQQLSQQRRAEGLAKLADLAARHEAYVEKSREAARAVEESLASGRSQSFQTEEGHQIHWNPIRVVAAPDPKRLATLQALAAKAQEHQTIDEAHQRGTLQEAPAPLPKNATKAVDLEPGEYVCRRFASATFRGAPRTYLFLAPAQEGGEATTDAETSTYGHFLEKEVEALGGVEALRKTQAPLLCNLSAERTTPQKKRDRRVALAALAAATTAALAAEQPTPEEPAAEQPTPEGDAAEQPTPEEPAAEQPTPGGNPAASAAAPIAEQSTPNEGAAPVAEQPMPEGNAAAPIAGQPAPEGDAAAPVEEQSTPEGDTTVPILGRSPPAAVPAEEQPTPVAEQTAPEGGIAAPVAGQPTPGGEPDAEQSASEDEAAAPKPVFCPSTNSERLFQFEHLFSL